MQTKCVNKILLVKHFVTRLLIMRVSSPLLHALLGSCNRPTLTEITSETNLYTLDKNQQAKTLFSKLNSINLSFWNVIMYHAKSIFFIDR